MAFIAGTEAGQSKLEAQNWVPRKPKRARLFRYSAATLENSEVALIDRALHFYIKRNVIRVYNDAGDRIPYENLVQGRSVLKSLVGRELRLSGGRVIGSDDLNIMIRRFLDDEKAAWNRVHGASVKMGHVDRIGNRGSGTATGDYLRDIEAK